MLQWNGIEKYHLVQHVTGNLVPSPMRLQSLFAFRAPVIRAHDLGKCNSLPASR